MVVYPRGIDVKHMAGVASVMSAPPKKAGRPIRDALVLLRYYTRQTRAAANVAVAQRSREEGKRDIFVENCRRCDKQVVEATARMMWCFELRHWLLSISRVRIPTLRKVGVQTTSAMRTQFGTPDKLLQSSNGKN